MGREEGDGGHPVCAAGGGPRAGGFLRPPLEERESGGTRLGCWRGGEEGQDFMEGLEGEETGQNTRWKIEGEEVEESDRGFKASGSILRKRSLAGKLALPALAAGGREGLF